MNQTCFTLACFCKRVVLRENCYKKYFSHKIHVYNNNILGPCCLNETCTLAREFLKCFDGTDCQESLVCDGLKYTCPEPKFKRNLTLCDKDRSVCINGYCQGSLCLKYGYEGCLCEGSEDKCKVCCQYEGSCKSSYEIPGVCLLLTDFSLCYSADPLLSTGGK